MNQIYTLFRNAFTCSCTYKTNNVFKPGFENKIIIYDYCENKQEYKNKCKEIIFDMIDKKLIEYLYDLEKSNMEIFRTKYNLQNDEFNIFDYEHVQIAKPLLKQIFEQLPLVRTTVSSSNWLHLNYKVNFNNVQFDTDTEMNQLTKLIMKKYIIEEKPTDRKVIVNVIVDNKQEIKVVSYNNTNKKGYCFKDPKGSIKQNESAFDALIREMKEELEFDFPIERYSTQDITDKHIKYNIHITKEECDDHFNNLDFKTLDPEITHIVLQDINNK